MTEPTCGILAGEQEIVGERCADGGKCHHNCLSKCWRRDSCLPLGASGLQDDWTTPTTGRRPWPFMSTAFKP